MPKEQSNQLNKMMPYIVLLSGIIILVSYFFLPWVKSTRFSDTSFTGSEFAAEYLEIALDSRAYSLSLTLEGEDAAKDALIERLGNAVIYFLPAFSGIILVLSGLQSVLNPKKQVKISSVQSTKLTKSVQKYVDNIVQKADSGNRLPIFLIIGALYLGILLICGIPYFLPLITLNGDLSSNAEVGTGFWICVVLGIIAFLSLLGGLIYSGITFDKDNLAHLSLDNDDPLPIENLDLDNDDALPLDNPIS